MTTTITVETHNWPLEVQTNQSHGHSDPMCVSHGYSHRTEFVDKNTKRQFSVGSGTTVTFRELPSDATGILPDQDRPADAGSATA